MVRVKVRWGATPEEKAANFEAAMKMFKRKVNNDGILTEMKKRRWYISPGEKRREAKKEAIRKEAKRRRKEAKRHLY